VWASSFHDGGPGAASLPALRKVKGSGSKTPLAPGLRSPGLYPL
jgi:hypothetical protein